ncbi:hypothetical protein OAC17_00340 [Flavobacteriaceae bacterium]|nr:hypothetical protein [Flavobacteriaceae bacterium]
MKKGLLSLLAVALTVVSCQNYDDQFASLTDQITTLSTTVAGLTAIKDQVTALQQTVNGLATTSALDALSGVVGTVATGVDANADAIADNATNATNNAAAAAAATASATAAANAAGAAATAAGAAATAAGDAVADVAAQVVSVQASLTAILADLENVATAADLATISATLAIVQADVKEILAGSAVINQNITINNGATLEYTQSLVGTEVDDPNVIVNGSVTINTTSFSPAITADQLAAVNEITAKLATILGHGTTTVGLSVTSATPLEFTNLTFIDDDYTISGSDQNDDALTTVTGDLTAGHGGEATAFDYSQLVSVGGDLTIAAADAATATSINLQNVDITGDFIEAGQAAGNLQFEGATSIDLGTADFHKLVAPKANSIVSGMTTTASLTIDAGNGGSIDLNSLTAITVSAGLKITGTSTSVFHFDALTTVTAGPIDADNGAGEVHLGALTTIGGVVDIDATTAAALSSIVTLTQTTDLNDTPAVILTALEAITANLTWDVAVIDLGDVDLTDDNLISSVATDVTIKAFDAIAQVPATTHTLELTAMNSDFTAGTGAVSNVTVTAASGADVDFTGDDADLAHVTLDGTTINDIGSNSTNIISVALANTSTNTINASATVATVTLSGHLVAFTSDATTLAEFNNTATFLDKPGNADTPITIHIHDTPLLTSIDLSSMEKVAIVDIQDNINLTALLAPNGSSNLLTANAGASFTILGNSITATYTNAVAAFPGDGINSPTAYEETCIYSPSLATWADYIANVYTTNTTITYSFDIDTATAGRDNFSADSAVGSDAERTHSFAGTIDTAAELAVISASACD